MAEIATKQAETATNQDPGVPQGNFEGWTESKSENGNTFYYRAVDSDGTTILKREEGHVHQVQASGPPFSGKKVFWKVGTDGNTSTEFANETGITWYKLQKTIGWTYQLTINANDTYNYTFHSAVDKYSLDVRQTATTHQVTMTTFDPTIISVDGE